MNFVKMNVGIILNDPGRRSRIARFLEHSILYTGSDFSCMNCTEDCLLSHLQCCSDELKIPLVYRHTRACDESALCRDVLLAREVDKCKVIFSDFWERVADLSDLDAHIPGADATAEEALEA